MKIKSLCILIVMLNSFNLCAQLNWDEIELSVHGVYHNTHAGVLGNVFSPGAGFYARIYLPESHYYLEIGTVRFAPQQDAFFDSFQGTTLVYSDYTAFPLNFGVLFDVYETDDFEFYAGGYFGYWINGFEFTENGPGVTSHQVERVAKGQFGAIGGVQWLSNDFTFGLELRYGGLLPLASGSSVIRSHYNDAYEGLIMAGLKVGYIIY